MPRSTNGRWVQATPPIIHVGTRADFDRDADRLPIGDVYVVNDEPDHPAYVKIPHPKTYETD